MKKLSLAMLAAATLFAGAAHAAPTQDQGFYAGAGIGYSQFGGLGNTAGLGVDKGDVGFTFYGGYRFNEFVAVEGGYSQLGDVTLKAKGLEVPVRNTMVSASVLGYLPEYKGLQAYGRAGVAETYSKALGADVHRTSALLGVGAEYDLTKNYTLRAELQYVPDFAVNDNHVFNATAGLKVKF